jgi:hypothetical protein
MYYPISFFLIIISAIVCNIFVCIFTFSIYLYFIVFAWRLFSFGIIVVWIKVIVFLMCFLYVKFTVIVKVCAYLVKDYLGI